jgi:hypothetical protein
MFKFGRYPLRLRFLEGEGEAEVDSTLDSNTEPTASTEAGVNPAWEGISSKLDPISFHAIQDDLKAMDAAAQKRIESQNAQYAPYKQFVDAGATPEDITAALNIAQQINSNPEAIYQALESFLTDNGRLPSKKELAQEVKENEAEAQGQQPVEDPRIQQIEAQQQQIAEYFQQQQHAQAVAQADAELQQETTTLQTAHPELSREDLQEIIGRAAFVAQTTGQIPSLEEVYGGWFTGLRNRILTTPRPGDSAPRLLPSGGAIPSNIPQKSLGELSRQETQDLVSSILIANKQNS